MPRRIAACGAHFYLPTSKPRWRRHGCAARCWISNCGTSCRAAAGMRWRRPGLERWLALRRLFRNVEVFQRCRTSQRDPARLLSFVERSVCVRRGVVGHLGLEEPVSGMGPIRSALRRRDLVTAGAEIPNVFTTMRRASSSPIGRPLASAGRRQGSTADAMSLHRGPHPRAEAISTLITQQ